MSLLNLRGFTIITVLFAILSVSATKQVVYAQDPDLSPLVQLLQQLDDDNVRLDILKGMREGLRGRKKPAMPQGWVPLYAKLSQSKSDGVRKLTRELALTFGDKQALEQLRVAALNKKLPLDERRAAIEALLENRPSDLPDSLRQLLADESLRADAIRGLAGFAHPQTPNWLLEIYEQLSDNEKQDVVNTLASRAAYAKELLNAIEHEKIARTDVSAFTARQLASLADPGIDAQLESIWGKVRESSADKKALIEKFKLKLNEKFFQGADPSNGRLVFSKTCMKCHKLYGEGTTIGPDITGSNRANLDYVLHNVLDPSAAISKDYQMSTVITVNGRVLTGIVQQRDNTRVVIQSVNEHLTLPAEDVDEINLSPLSMMPEGQFDKLSDADIRDLVIYLRTKSQVPLPKQPQ